MKNIFVVIVLLFITKTVFSQASGSTEFEIEISLVNLSDDSKYEFYALEFTGINDLLSCNYKLDTIKNTVKFFGNLSYIVPADVLTFVISQKTIQETTSYGIPINREVVKNHIIRINKINSIKKELKTIELKPNEPFIEIRSVYKNQTLEIQTKYYSHITESDFIDVMNQEWIVVKTIK